MVKVSIRVRSGAARLDVAVLAESAEQAVGRDRGAMEAFKDSDIYRDMRANPHFENVTVTDFAVVERVRRVTRGPVGVAENTKGKARCARSTQPGKPPEPAQKQIMTDPGTGRVSRASGCAWYPLRGAWRS